ESYLIPYKDLADSIRGHQLNEQHNIFIQVFSEFGPFCYVFFCFQLHLLFRKIANVEVKTMFISLLFGYLFLNGLNDYILYLLIGFILRSEKEVFFASR